MTRISTILGALAGDESGQVAIEWAMILAVFGIPMIYIFATLLSALSEHYRMVAFLQTLPFP
jgi:Flp pilus assembly pilin Flp